VWDRSWLIMSLAELGRFAEASEHEMDVIRLAELTRRAFPIGLAHFAVAELHLLKGSWEAAHALMERMVAVTRTGNLGVLLPSAVISAALVVAQLGNASEALKRLQEGEVLLERSAARGVVGL